MFTRPKLQDLFVLEIFLALSLRLVCCKKKCVYLTSFCGKLPLEVFRFSSFIYSYIDGYASACFGDGDIDRPFCSVFYAVHYVVPSIEEEFIPCGIAQLTTKIFLW